MKKITIILFLISVLSQTAAQSFLTSNQAMVKASVEQSIVITCSGYKLQDSTGQHYGRNNRAEFNQIYSLAIATDSGLIVPTATINPWMFDGDFDRYRSSHTPVLCKIGYRQIKDSVFFNPQLTADSTSSRQLFRMPTDSLEGIPHLAIHTGSSYNNGWLLWVYASDTLGNAGITSTTAVMAPSNISDTVPEIQVPAPMTSGMLRDSIASRKPIGAVWVVPCYPQPGMVQFRVAGLAVRDTDGWILAPLRFHTAAEAIEEQPQISSDELTPSPEPQQATSKKNKKNKKK